LSGYLRPASDNGVHGVKEGPEMGTGRVDVRRQDGVWVLSLLGEHDLTTQEALRAELRNLMSTGVGVVVDLTQADFIDGTVIGALVAGHDEAGRNPGDRLAIVISGDGVFADRVVSMAGVDRVIPTFVSRRTAITSLVRPPQSRGVPTTGER